MDIFFDVFHCQIYFSNVSLFDPFFISLRFPP